MSKALTQTYGSLDFHSSPKQFLFGALESAPEVHRKASSLIRTVNKVTQKHHEAEFHPPFESQQKTDHSVDYLRIISYSPLRTSE